MKVSAIRIAVVASLIILLAALTSATARAATITIRPRADVASAVVRLDDVADIVGESEGGRLKELLSIAICAAPAPAETQTLGMNTILSALNASGIDLTGLTLAGSPTAIVTREYDTVSADELKRVFTAHVSDSAGWPVDSFLVKAPKNFRAFPVPIGTREIEVETRSEEDFRGSVSTRFRVMVDGELHRALSHRFAIERYVDALVAARKIPRGKPIMPGDVKMAKVKQSKRPKESADGIALTRVEQVVGLLAVRTIPAGKAISADLLTLAPLVRKGEFKSVVSAGNGFRIMTRGRLLEDGAADQMVRVRLPSRKIIRAMVVDSKTLRFVRQGE
jgi:flagella basal body P-ring formation protein FlgA